ncbi:MAG: GHKL domain-containing protein [Bacillota bacterium]|nr:GHKL domain-containing protein [Bacillota bacterium]
MNTIIVNVIFETINFFIVSLFFTYLSKKNISKKYLIISLFYGLSETLLNWFLDTYLPDLVMIKPFISLMLQVFFISFTVKIPYLLSFKYLVAIDLLLGFSNVITIIIFKIQNIPINLTEIAKHVIYVIYGDIINTICLFFIVFIIYKKNKEIVNLSGKMKRAPLAIIGFTFLMLSANLSIYFFFLRKYSIPVWFIISVTVIICAYFIAILILTKKFYYFSIKENELLQQEFYNNILKSTLQPLKRYKHDFNNNISVMNMMLLTKKYKELEDYMNQLIKFSRSTNTEITMLDINNAALHGLISSKLKYAEQNNINLDLIVIGEISDIKSIKMMDLCEVLGIILDNAIEASRTGDDVTFYIEQSDSYTKFKIENYFYGEIGVFSQIRSGNYSSKGGDHGNGLRIVKNIIKDYKNIDFDIGLNPENKLFHVEIVNHIIK